MTTFNPNENECTEFKRELTDTIEKEVVAFLNSPKDGDIFIGLEDEGKASEKSSEKILRLLKGDSHLTISELVTELDISNRAIDRHVKNLQADGLLCRIGGRKEGRWVVVE